MFHSFHFFSLFIHRICYSYKSLYYVQILECLAQSKCILLSK
uniref:Uncharacterized protein n=1 Tax=Rhizophora mucronata TaxID=61149 RepID=A0A2P2NB10_RHIMU